MEFMNRCDQLFARYATAVNQVLNGYLTRYFEANPGSRSAVTGRAFLANYNEEYIREISRIASDTINDSAGSDKELYAKIFKQNQIAIGALSNEIMNDALGIRMPSPIQ